MTIKTISKPYLKGGKELDVYQIGDKYSPQYFVLDKELTRTRKTMWVTLKLIRKTKQ